MSAEVIAIRQCASCDESAEHDDHLCEECRAVAEIILRIRANG